MGNSKNELFSVQHNQMATMAKALSHPARIAILEYMIEKGSCICGDIVAEVPLSQSTVSQHLKAMKDAGIIKGEVDGPYRCYCINMTTCQSLVSKIRALFAKANCC